MDHEKVRRTSMNPPTREELLETVEKLENATRGRAYAEDSIDYCGDLCCYLMAHVMPLGNNVLTAAPLAAALRVVADQFIAAFGDAPEYAEAVNAYATIVQLRSETIHIRVPRGGRHE